MSQRQSKRGTKEDEVGYPPPRAPWERFLFECAYCNKPIGDDEDTIKVGGAPVSPVYHARCWPDAYRALHEPKTG